jgi:hypothetical protein
MPSALRQVTSHTASAAIDRDAVAMHGQIIDTYDNQPIPSAEIWAGCGESLGTLIQADATGSYSLTKGQLYDFIDYECPFALGLAMNAYEEQYDRGDDEWVNFDHDYDDWDQWIDEHFTGQYFDFHLTGDGSQDKTAQTGFTNVSDKTVMTGTTLATVTSQVEVKVLPSKVLVNPLIPIIIIMVEIDPLVITPIILLFVGIHGQTQSERTLIVNKIVQLPFRETI